MFLYEMGAKFAELGMWAEADMPDVRQNAACGIAVVAKNLAPQAFASLIPNVLKALERIMTGPTSDDDEKAAVENAISALGIVALKHTKDQAQISKFLSSLPLSGEGENQEATDYLLEHYE